MIRTKHASKLARHQSQLSKLEDRKRALECEANARILALAKQSGLLLVDFSDAEVLGGLKTSPADFTAGPRANWR